MISDQGVDRLEMVASDDEHNAACRRQCSVSYNVGDENQLVDGDTIKAGQVGTDIRRFISPTS